MFQLLVLVTFNFLRTIGLTNQRSRNKRLKMPLETRGSASDGRDRGLLFPPNTYRQLYKKQSYIEVSQYKKSGHINTQTFHRTIRQLHQCVCFELGNKTSAIKKGDIGPAGRSVAMMDPRHVTYILMLHLPPPHPLTHCPSVLPPHYIYIYIYSISIITAPGTCFEITIKSCIAEYYNREWDIVLVA